MLYSEKVCCYSTRLAITLHAGISDYVCCYDVAVYYKSSILHISLYIVTHI